MELRQDVWGADRGPNTGMILLGALVAVVGVALAFATGGGLWFVPAVAGLLCLALGFLPSPRRNHARVAAAALVAVPVFTLVVFGLDEYNGRPRRPVWVILPDGYTGQFSIIKDVQHGRRPEVRGGVWVFEVPPEGVLRVVDTAPFFVPHRGGVAYKNGTRVAVDNLTFVGPSMPAEFRGTSTIGDDGSMIRGTVVRK